MTYRAKCEGRKFRKRMRWSRVWWRELRDMARGTWASVIQPVVLDLELVMREVDDRLREEGGLGQLDRYGIPIRASIVDGHHRMRAAAELGGRIAAEIHHHNLLFGGALTELTWDADASCFTAKLISPYSEEARRIDGQLLRRPTIIIDPETESPEPQ